MALAPGYQVNARLQLVRPLGAGAMGSIWVARDVELGIEVAVKFIAEEHANDPETLKRFQREVRIATKLDCPNIVKLLGSGTTPDGAPFMVMELLEGETLGERLERLGPLPLDDTAAIVGQVARALAESHNKGLIHRDIKPDNVFLVGYDAFPLVKVLDFGAAREVVSSEGGGELTQVGAAVGTPHYMSPEQVLGGRDVDHRCDLWALSVVAYKCLTGQLPFTAPSPPALCFVICKGDFTAVSDLGVAAVFDGFFRTGLSTRKQKRFQSAGELAKAFADALSRADLPADFTNESTAMLNMAQLQAAVRLRAASSEVGELPPLSDDFDPIGPTSSMGATHEYDQDTYDPLANTSMQRSQESAAAFDSISLALAEALEGAEASGQHPMPESSSPASFSGEHLAAYSGRSGAQSVPARESQVFSSRSGAGPESGPVSSGPLSGPRSGPYSGPVSAPISSRGAPPSARAPAGGDAKPSHRWAMPVALLLVAGVAFGAVKIDAARKAAKAKARGETSAAPASSLGTPPPLPPPPPPDPSPPPPAPATAAPTASAKTVSTKQGSMTIICEPGCQQVWIPGHALGKAPIEKFPLDPGNYRVTLVSGAKTKVLVLTIRAGKETKKRVFLYD